jgi:hypothetical protein
MPQVKQDAFADVTVDEKQMSGCGAAISTTQPAGYNK